MPHRVRHLVSLSPVGFFLHDDVGRKKKNNNNVIKKKRKKLQCFPLFLMRVTRGASARLRAKPNPKLGPNLLIDDRIEQLAFYLSIYLFYVILKKI